MEEEEEEMEKRKIKFDLCVSNYRYTPHARLRIIAMKRETFRQLLDLSLSLESNLIVMNSLLTHDDDP